MCFELEGHRRDLIWPCVTLTVSVTFGALILIIMAVLMKPHQLSLTSTSVYGDAETLVLGSCDLVEINNRGGFWQLRVCVCPVFLIV